MATDCETWERVENVSRSLCVTVTEHGYTLRFPANTTRVVFAEQVPDTVQVRAVAGPNDFGTRWVELPRIAEIEFGTPFNTGDEQ